MSFRIVDSQNCSESESESKSETESESGSESESLFEDDPQSDSFSENSDKINFFNCRYIFSTKII